MFGYNNNVNQVIEVINGPDTSLRYLLCDGVNWYVNNSI